MQFYKWEGISADENWLEEIDSRLLVRERTMKVAKASNNFNKKLDKQSYFFVVDASDTVTIGGICREPYAVEKQFSAFLKAVDMELKDEIDFTEVTLEEIEAMLSWASRNDFIKDDDAVMEQFNFPHMNRRGALEIGENMIESLSKEAYYREAEQILARDTFLPELDRIYAFTPKVKKHGHPVHYMVQTDDREIRKKMYQTLLGALYDSGRLHGRRYAFLDIKPGIAFSKKWYDSLYQSSMGCTIVVRYLANDDSENEYASSDRENIEILCEVMKKYRNDVLTIFCLPRECTNAKSIFYEYLGNTSFVELKEEFVCGERAMNYLKRLAKSNSIRCDNKLFAMLEEEKTYLAPNLQEIFDEWYNNKMKTGLYPQYKDIGTVRQEVIKEAPRGSAYDELMEMIGLDEAKKIIKQMLNYAKAQRLFANKGMKVEHMSMHMVFTGNPGTAKTTVARLFARIMKENDLISKGNIVEVGRGDLVGKYVGWTAPTIQKKFAEAKGGVLFIDEAYSLVDDRDGSYGDEAINTIVQEMENHRNDVVVIFAGYPDKMERFLQKNPGLRSRIAFHVPFTDYSTENLCDIAKMIAKQKGVTLSEDAAMKLSSIFEEARKQGDFGNGRYVRNIVERAKMAQATRLLSEDFDSLSQEDIASIQAVDIEVPFKVAETQKSRIGFGVSAT